MGTDAREPLLDPGEDPRVGDALASIAQALSVPPDEMTARRHRNAIARARQVQPLVIARRSVATGVAAAVLIGALAVGGALPRSVQDTVADLASRVGIVLPRSTTDSEVPPPLPAGRDDEATDADTSLEDDRADERDERDGTSRGGDRDAVPATESTRPGPADEVPDEADRSEAPTTPSEADDHVPSDPPADAPGSGAGSPPAPAPPPTPTPSDPPVSRPSPPAPPASDHPPSGQGDAAPPRPDEDDRDDPREDRRAGGTDEPRPVPAHPV
jgi:hypothetical protein